METLSSEHRFWLGVVMAGVGTVFCLGNIVRSIWLKKGFSEATIKMYIVFMLTTFVGVLGTAGVISGDAVIGLFGAVAGYALGNKPFEGAPKQE